MAKNAQRVTTHLIPDDHRMVNLGDSTHEFNAIRSASVAADTAAITTVTATTVTATTVNATTVAGSATKLGALNLAVATPKVLSASESGQAFVGVVDCAFTLPTAAAAGAGAHYHIITGVASAGTGVTVTRAGSDTIDGRVSPTGATITDATVLTNTPGTDVKGDSVWLLSDGVSKWHMIGITGVWAGA